MPPAPLPPGEPERLAALARYRVLDTPSEEAFDRITRLAAQVLNVPVAVVNFLAGDRQWSKACHGVVAGEVARADSVCAWTVLTPDPLVVPDARQDARLMDSPFVRAGQIGLYAGVPLVTPDGHQIGTLCVTDSRPRAFGPAEVETLRMLAALVMDELELRLRTQELTRARDHARTLRDLAELMNEPLGLDDTARGALKLLHERTPLSWAALLRLTPTGVAILTDHTADPASSRAFRGAMRERLAQDRDTLVTALTRHKRGFLEGAAAAACCPPLQAAGLGSVAWLHLPRRQGANREDHYVLLLARLGASVPWLTEERALLEAAARSVGIALERAEQVASLERAALTDPLTGLGNRRALDEALDDLDRRFQQLGRGYALGVVDLDGMKRVNDERGHASGDDLLREFAEQLVAPGVLAYRLGGDEYALLHLGPESPEEGEQVLQALVAGAERHVRARGYPTGASLGVVTVPGGAPEPSSALRRADKRMYVHKRERRAARPSPDAQPVS